MKKFNRGFSLVELLAAIVIMGILSGIAVVGITFLLNKAEREYYKAQESEVIMAAKSYTQDNRSFLPKRVGQKNQIYLKTLQDKKYIGDVLDRNKKKCDPDRSYVQVYRYNKNNYSYVVNLVCDKYTSEGRNPTNLVGPDIKFVFSGIGANDNYDLAKVTVTIEDEDKISGYRYIISKSGNEIKNSGDIDGKLEKKVTFTIPLKEFVPGTVEVKVIATDFYGNESTKKETKTIKNSKAPTCTVLKANTTWTNKPPVEVQVKCIDYTGLGCKKDVYTQLFYTEAKIGLVEMEDNTGNKGECSANTYIDLTPPSTPVIKNTYENKWTNKSYTVQVTSVDSTSGIAYFEYRYPNSVGKDGSGNPENEWHRYKNSSKEPGDNTPFVTTAFSKEREEYVEIRACDRAGNCSGSGRSMIKIDKTRPTCTITRNKANPDGLNDWYVTNVNLTLIPKNNHGSGDRAVDSPISYDLKNKNKASYNGATTNTQKETKGITWYGFIKDEAGNTNTCNSGKFKVDTTKPDKPKITNPYENKWTNKSYSISIVSVDKTAGIDYFAYRYPGSTSPGENTWAKYDNSSRTPGVSTEFKTPNFSKERDENVEIKVCDVAGNCSGTSLSRIRIDKTAPTCTVTKNKAKPNGLNGWYKTKVTLTLSTTNPKGSSDRAVASGISYDLKNKNKASYNGVTTNTQSDTAGIIWYGFVKDEAGNKSTCNSGSFKVDTTKPTCSISKSGTVGSDNWYRSSVNLSLSKSDNMSGVASYGLTSSSSTTYNSKSSDSRSGETGSSKVSWYGYVKDNAGNTNNCSTTFGIDKTDPTVTTDSVSENTTWCSGAKRISISCSDSGSGISSSQIKDMGTTSSSSDILSSPRNGAATIYTCTDKAGNSSSKVKNFIVVKKTCTNYTRYYEKCGTTTQNCKKKATAVLCSYFGNKATCERYSSCTWSTWPFQGASCGGKKITENPVAYYKCDNYWTLSGTSCIRTTQTCPNGTFSSYNYGFTSKVAYNQSSCYTNSSFTCNSRYNNSEYTTSCDCKSWNCRE